MSERVAELLHEVNDLRALLGEIIDEFHEFKTATGGCHLASVSREQIAKWRQSAGLELVVVTAGTEHLAAEITRLVIPDEES